MENMTHYIEKLRDLCRDAVPNDCQIEEIRGILSEYSNYKSEPVDFVRWIHIDKISANDYNPNSVAKKEMRLLYSSIYHDGYTQPIVAYHDPGHGKYIIIDGFHRFLVMKTNKDIYDRTNGYLPLVILTIEPNDRMASTVRHNRARGKHTVSGMSELVFSMLDNGWGDSKICNELGMEPEELLRLKHITGFSKLFDNIEYRKSWQSKRQIKLKEEYQDEA